MTIGPALSAPRRREKIVFMEEGEQHKQIALLDQSGLRYLTEGDDWHLYPDIDAAGRQVAMVSGPDENHLAVETLELSSGDVTTWTEADGKNLHPTFSGDSRTLAYSRETADGQRHIALIDLEDGDTAVLPGSERGFFPALSQDANLVVYQKNGEERQIVCHDRHTGDERVVATGMSPSLSFDDQWVAYTSFQDGQWNIHMNHLESGEHRQVTHTEHLDFAPSFTEDGGLLLASNRGGDFAIYHISSEELENGGESVETVWDGPHTYYAPDASGLTCSDCT